MAMIHREVWGTLPDGQELERFTLENQAGMKVSILNYGGVIQSILVPDREGVFEDVLLGYDHAEGYLQDTAYMGALVGRYANRIAGARFRIGGNEYQLPQNDGKNCLHGGGDGSARKIWDATIIGSGNSASLRLELESPDGDQGFPGKLITTAIYSLSDEGELDVRIEAISDKATVINYTLHPYFNLAGAARGDVLDHEVQIFGEAFIPIDGEAIPLGHKAPVASTPMDFRQAKPLGSDLEQNHEQLQAGGGYDHTWVIQDQPGELVRMATVVHPGSGRELGVYADSPGVQFYSGNHLPDAGLGKGGKPHGYRKGFCLEPQFFPDTPNQPAFPPCLYEAGEKYTHHMRFAFGMGE